MATSIVVYAEVTEYIKGLLHFTRRHNELRQLLREIYPYFLTYPILERYADIRRSIRPPHDKGLFGGMDTLIAATAVERHLTIITRSVTLNGFPISKQSLYPSKQLNRLS